MAAVLAAVLASLQTHGAVCHKITGPERQPTCRSPQYDIAKGTVRHIAVLACSLHAGYETKTVLCQHNTKPPVQSYNPMTRP
jgi:hypothetical protein